MAAAKTITTALNKNLCESRTEVDPDGVSWKNRIIRAVINSDDVDYHQTVLMPDGCRYQNFLDNQGGVVLWLHGNDPTRGALPIGNVRAIERVNRNGRSRLIAEVDLDEDDAFTENVKRKYLLKKWRGWSVRGLPREYSKPTSAELRSHPDWSDAHTIFRVWDLVEVSATPIQSNQSAVTDGFTRSAGKLDVLRGTAHGYCRDSTGICTVWKDVDVVVNGEVYTQRKIVAETDEEAAKLMTDWRR
jgi:hypothetical protein